MFEYNHENLTTFINRLIASYQAANQICEKLLTVPVIDAFLDLLAVNHKGSRINLRVNDRPETLIAIGQTLSKYKVRFENLVTMEIKGEDYLMILRTNTIDSKPIINDFKAAGFKVESIQVKQ